MIQFARNTNENLCRNQMILPRANRFLSTRPAKLRTQPLFSWCFIHLSFTLTVNSDSSLNSSFLSSSFSLHFHRQRKHTHTRTWACVATPYEPRRIFFTRMIADAIWWEISWNAQLIFRFLILDYSLQLNFIWSESIWFTICEKTNSCKWLLFSFFHFLWKTFNVIFVFFVGVDAE